MASLRGDWCLVKPRGLILTAARLGSRAMCSPSPTGPLARLLDKRAVSVNSIPRKRFGTTVAPRRRSPARPGQPRRPGCDLSSCLPSRMSLQSSQRPNRQLDDHSRRGLLLTPVLGQVTAASARMDPPMVRRKPWRVGSTEIEVLTDRWDGPAVDHGAIAEVGGTANRGLCQCERTDQAEGGRQNDCCEGHAAFPCFARRNEEGRGLVASCDQAPPRPCDWRGRLLQIPFEPSATIGFVLQERLASQRYCQRALECRRSRCGRVWLGRRRRSLSPGYERQRRGPCEGSDG